jgi:hypothetical protein
MHKSIVKSALAGIAAGLLILLVPLAGHFAALLLGVIVTTLLAALAAWELRAPARDRLPAH